jgi:hypothetical protein
MSSTSCVVLTSFARYVVFYYVKVSQVKNLSTPLRRAHRDDQDEHIICDIWSTGEKSSINTTRRTLEDPRTIIITRLGTKPTRFDSFAK